MKIESINALVVLWGPLSEEGLSAAKKMQHDFGYTICVPENRPYMIGLHNMAQLKKEGVSFCYCTDNMLGFLFYKKKVKEMFLFYKERTSLGVAACSGSLFAARLANLHGVSIKGYREGVFDYNTLDKDASTIGGKRFILEGQEQFVERVRDELLTDVALTGA